MLLKKELLQNSVMGREMNTNFFYTSPFTYCFLYNKNNNP
jgi:hypothetical protein